MAIRRLSVIMFTDIVGYAKVLESNEQVARDLVNQSRELQKSLVESHNGTWMKDEDDISIVLFDSAHEAVQCALDIQQEANKKLDKKLRIGINLGDIKIDDHEIIGEEASLTSRLESLAEPGGIYISESLLNATQDELELDSVYIGEVSSKKVKSKIKAYALQGDGLPEAYALSSRPDFMTGIVWPFIASLVAIVLSMYIYNKFDIPHQEKNSIAVIAFRSINADEESRTYSDRVTMEIQSDLDDFMDIHIDSEITIQKNLDDIESLKEIARENKVNYLLTGSVEKAGNRLTIFIRLIDPYNSQNNWNKGYRYADINKPNQVDNEVVQISYEIREFLNSE